MEEVWGSNEAQRQQMERKLEKEVETGELSGLWPFPCVVSIVLA